MSDHDAKPDWRKTPHTFRFVNNVLSSGTLMQYRRRAVMQILCVRAGLEATSDQSIGTYALSQYFSP